MKRKDIISERAWTVAKSIMPFVNVSGREKIIENHARDIQRAMEQYWPEMNKNKSKP